MKKANFLPSLVLGSICLAVALLLSLVNMITAPIIKEAQDSAANEALLEVLPGAKGFEELTLNDKYPTAIKAAYKADIGFVFRTEVTGKSAGLIIMCGVDSTGKIVSTKVIADDETDSYDAKVFPFVEGVDGAYKNMDMSSYEPYLVSGATLTSRAYSQAVLASLQSFVIANGGEVDIRTPEQILQDNCNASLGTTGLVFKRWFATEVLDGVSSVYEADGGKRVYLVGDVYVGIDENSQIVGTVSADASEKALAAHALVSASTLSEITDRGESIHSSIKKIYVTSTGNYVFEVNGNGFSVHQYEEYGSGKNLPISVKISISKDAKIIDALTLDHAETQGYGDKCATEEYRNSLIGADGNDIVISNGPISADNTDVGAISGATYTSKGYQTAIKYAFEAFKAIKLTGGESNG